MMDTGPEGTFYRYLEEAERSLDWAVEQLAVQGALYTHRLQLRQVAHQAKELRRFGRLVAQQPGQTAYSIIDAKAIGRFMPPVFPGVKADTLESLIGATYLQHGLSGARAVILRLFSSLLATAPTLGAALEWKSSLQELTSARGLGVPRYEVIAEGPDHDRRFNAVVYVAGEPYGNGAGKSKKAAETDAAAQAWTALDAEPLPRTADLDA